MKTDSEGRHRFSEVGLREGEKIQGCDQLKGDVSSVSMTMENLAEARG